MIDDDEKVLPGPLKGLATEEEKAVYRYKRPTRANIEFRRRVLQVENWVARHGLVQKDDVVLYIMRAFDMEREQANRVFKAVYEDFKRKGLVYGDNK